MIERFQYHAFAVGAAGRIDAPFEEIDSRIQASCALPETGGFGTARVERYRFRDTFSFHAITSAVSRLIQPEGPILRRLGYRYHRRAESSGHGHRGPDCSAHFIPALGRRQEEHSITPLGSYFENLRIAGYLVELRLATDTFSKFDTFDKVKKAYQGKHG